MALSIKNRELEAISRELAAVTGKPITEALLEGARRELQRQKGIQRFLSKEVLWDEIREIQRQVAQMPDVDPRSAEDIIGFNESGHFDK